MKAKPRLGRGIDAIFADSIKDDASQIIEIPSDEIYPNPIQPRKLSLIHISEPTRHLSISYAVFCLKKKKHQPPKHTCLPLYPTNHTC